MAERRGPHALALVVEEETQADAEDRAHQLERSPTQADALEATELERLRRNYSRASASRRSGSTTIARKPVNLLERFTYNVKKTWKHQVSITVEHSTCRDHLGMYQGSLSRLHVLSLCRVDPLLYLDMDPEVTLRTSLASPCTMSSGTFAKA